jgi:ABC-type phosphate transport system substrate-binding protein
MVGAAMTTLRTLTIATLLIAGCLALAAKAAPPASKPSDSPDGPVVVIHGSQTQVQGAPQKAAGQRSRATPAAQTEQGVVVMRPASGSFMRETARLSAEADAREERAAQEEAREVNQQLTRTLQAVADAARAAEDEARTRSRRYYPVYVPPPHPPKVRPPTDQPIGR